MRKRFMLLAASFFALFSTGQLAAQPPVNVTLVKAGHLLDPRTGERGRIRHVLVLSWKNTRRSNGNNVSHFV